MTELHTWGFIDGRGCRIAFNGFGMEILQATPEDYDRLHVHPNWFHHGGNGRVAFLNGAQVEAADIVGTKNPSEVVRGFIISWDHPGQRVYGSVRWEWELPP